MSKLKKIRSKIYYGTSYIETFLQVCINLKKKNTFIIGAPYHSNMGDQAQTECTIQWCNKNYPNHKVIVISTKDARFKNYFLLSLIEKYIKKDDRIFLHSGYHTTDLYMAEESLNREVIKRFTKNKVIVLPQTIKFEDKNQENITSKIYSNHPDITFLARDEISFEKAQLMFTNNKVLLFPDIVTTFIGKKNYNSDKNGILFCMRNDKEAFYSKAEIEILKNKYSEKFNVKATDTTLDIDMSYLNKNRSKILEEIFKEYSTYKVIITDRYHGTIFSQIANTPVIVLNSADHKLSSGVKWFPEQFKDRVFFANNLEEVEKLVEQIMQAENKYEELIDYFNLNYYDKLKGLIESNY